MLDIPVPGSFRNVGHYSLGQEGSHQETMWLKLGENRRIKRPTFWYDVVCIWYNDNFLTGRCKNKM